MSRFAPVKVRERKSLSGTIGEGAWASTKGKAEETGEGEQEAAGNLEVCPSQPGRFDQAIDESTETEGDDQGAEKVEPLGDGAVTLGNAPQGNEDHGGGQWEIDEEDPAPGSVLDEPAPKHRTEGSGNGGKAGPSSDSAAAIFLGK